MRIACLGNSHVASLKKGWETLDLPELEIAFFADRAFGMRRLVPRGRQLVPEDPALEQALRTTSGGMPRIDTDAFDVFVLYGMWAAPFFCDPSRFHSRAVLARAMRDVAEPTLSHEVFTLLRRATDKPVLIGHDPLPVCRDDTASQEVSDNYLEGMAAINAQYYRPLNARMLPQPGATIVAGEWTMRRYARGARRLSVGDHLDDRVHPENDPHHHMNGDFGALWLAGLARHLGGGSAREAATAP